MSKKKLAAEKTVRVAINGRMPITVNLDDYVSRKTRQLRQFGYPGLTEGEVRQQIELLAAGKKWTTVIGAMCEDEVVPCSP